MTPPLSLVWDNPKPFSEEPSDIDETETHPMYGGGNGGPPVDEETKRYVDVKTEATRAQNDAKFTEVMSELRSLPKPLTLIQYFSGLVAAIGFTLAVLAFAGDRFDGGMSASTDGAVAKELIIQQSSDIQKLIDAQAAENQKMLDALVDHHDGQKGFEKPE